MIENNEDIIQKKRNDWRRKAWSIPELKGSKQESFVLVKNLIKLIGENKVYDLDSIPSILELKECKTWRDYNPFLKGMGLVSNQAGVLNLTGDGILFLENFTEMQLAYIFQDKIKLFGEVLDLLSHEPLTIEEANEKIVQSYGLTWTNLSNIRKRMDWLEVLKLIEPIGSRKWKITNNGKKLLEKCELISPEVLEEPEIDSLDITITEPPDAINDLMNELFDNSKLHNKRVTYNIWAPSPNRIENLRIIVQASADKISKQELFKFICNEFSLKESSVESMLPFLKAGGFLEEIGRSIYCSTDAAKAWIETGNDLDFIRILHCHMRFVGEIIKLAERDIIRNDVYTKGKCYGLNAEKARWIVGFLIEAGVLEEPQYLHLKATPLGMKFVETLPLWEIEEKSESESETFANEKKINNELDIISNKLTASSIDPYAEGKQSGLAFELNIAEIFNYMGYDAKKIGGPGDTDVILKWKNDDDKEIIAIIDGKSKSNGQVSHGDISDVAIDTHKDKHKADYVAIVGSNFSGDTIKNHALKKQFALITVEQIITFAKSFEKLGLSLQELSLMFQVPNGISKLNDIILSKQRELDIISSVITKFVKEQEQIGSLSPRDLFLLLRDTSVSPSLEELIVAFESLSNKSVNVLRIAVENRLPENTMYMLCDTKKSVFKLRALASTIEESMKS